MMQVEKFKHQRITVGTMPIIDSVLEALGLLEVVDAFVKNKRYSAAIVALMKNMLVEPAALYRIPEWSRQFDPQSIGFGARFDDDVLGRALDKLFTVDRASLQTRLTMQTIKVFDVDVSKIHNDSTSIKFYGAYQSQGSKAIKLKRGHSKDHRPDLKQILYSLSITEDGAIPIHFKCYDGNVTDDTTHIETWLTLRGMLGRSDFLYVADCKLCTSSNMRKIDSEGGQFVTIVPRTRSEVTDFYVASANLDVRWVELIRKKSTRKKNRYDVFQVAEGLHQLAEGFRLFWYQSSEKKLRDQDSRTQRIESSLEKLLLLQQKVRRGPKSEKAMLKAGQDILNRYKTTEWIHLEVRSHEKEEFKKTSAGKPGPDATYHRQIKRIPYLIAKRNLEAIDRAASTDGIFPLTTNAKLTALEALAAYKYQPNIEKRFSYAKSNYEIAPVFLKKTERIEAIIFACYMADLVAAIIQRNLRLAMTSKGIKELKTLPEERPSATPTWEQIQRLFAHHSKFQLTEKGQILKSFWEELSEPQSQVLELLNVARLAYEG